VTALTAALASSPRDFRWARSSARTTTDGGNDGRPIFGAYRWAKSSSETISSP
jgi:hypothetical protein